MLREPLPVLEWFLEDQKKVSRQGFFWNISSRLSSWQIINLPRNLEFNTSLRLLAVYNNAFECPRAPLSILGACHLRFRCKGWCGRWKYALVRSLGRRERHARPITLVGWWRWVFQWKTHGTDLQHDGETFPLQRIDCEHQGRRKYLSYWLGWPNTFVKDEFVPSFRTVLRRLCLGI